MSKKKIEHLHKEFSKPQLSRWERQQKIQRIIFFAGIGIVVAVVLILLGGWYFTQFQPLGKTVLVVNDTRFNMADYVKILRAISKGQSPQFVESAASDVVQLMEQSEILMQGAARLGVSVSNDEVNAELKKSNPPRGQDYAFIIRAQLLAKKLKDEYFMSQVPQSAEQRHIEAMFLESEKHAVEVRTMRESGQSFSDLANMFSLDQYSKERKGDVGWHPERALELWLGSSVPGEYAFASEVGQLSQPRPDAEKTKPFGYWLIKVLEKRVSNQAHVQAMLLGSLDEAEKVKARLDKGEDFATIAKELSQYTAAKENGGDLGWISSGMMSVAFDQVFLAAATGVVSQPLRDNQVSTKGGFWLVRNLGKADDREISVADRDLLASDQFNSWFLLARASAKVENYLDDSRKAWAISRVSRGIGS